MDIFGIGFQLMSFNTSMVPPMQDFFRNNVASMFQPQPQKMVIPGFGVVDPNSIVPGLGLGAMDIPRPPSGLEFFQVTQMQYLQIGQREEYMINLREDVLQKKAEVFQSNHYEFDKNGNPVIDVETGKPKVFEGKETDQQRELRGKWEQKAIDEMNATHRKEVEDFTKHARQVLEDIQKNPMDFLDPEKAKIRQQQIMELQKQETEMNLRQAKEAMGVTTAHLPDPDSKDGSKISSFIDQGFDGYKELVANQEKELLESPAGRAVSDYFKAVDEWVNHQRKLIAGYRASQDHFDPDAMKKFARNINRIHL